MLSPSTIQDIIEVSISSGGDYAEVFVENSSHGMINAYADRVESSSFGREGGLGVRIFKGLESVYVCTNKTEKDDVIALIREAMSHSNPSSSHPAALSGLKNGSFQSAKINPSSIRYKQKLDVLQRAFSAGKKYAPEIEQMFAKYLEMEQHVQVANSEGLFVEDKRVKTRLYIMAYAQNENGLQSGYTGPGAMQGFEFYDTLDIEWHAQEAARIALTMLNAPKCQGGRMSVVVENGFGGLLFHEACGHSLESASVAKGTSEFSGKLGQVIASPLVTLVDDGTLKNEWGSLGIDDEGTPTQRNVLIENGVLKSYMVDRLGSRRMGLTPTGSARRENYRFAPTARMTNTFLEKGTRTREEIIADTEKGLYVKYINGGSVNPVTGEFNFSAAESYAIENGKITTPLSGATLIGSGSDILRKIDRIGNNLELKQGYCYAESGALFIGAGQPTVRIELMTVGGVK